MSQRSDSTTLMELQRPFFAGAVPARPSALAGRRAGTAALSRRRPAPVLIAAISRVGAGSKSAIGASILDQRDASLHMGRELRTLRKQLIRISSGLAALQCTRDQADVE